jgi:hypothetical protein
VTDLRARIERASAEPDPTRCNLRITLEHRRLSEALRQRTGLDAGANFHSWAVWGSKKAGVTVRQEDLEQALRDATTVSAVCGALVGVGVASIIIAALAWPWPLVALGAALGAVTGALVGRAIARWSRRRAAALVLEGNRLVLDDIGRVTARFCATFAAGARVDDRALDAFLAELTPGAAERGGQDLLREAFRLYAGAANATAAAERRWRCYFANCLAILHEHVKLQPYIEGSMPFIVRRCVTQRMLTFDVGPLALAVSKDVPALDGLHAPPDLARLTDPRLVEFLRAWDRDPDSLAGSRASDWSRLRDRMAYIVDLFRALHLDPSVLAPPYDDAQAAAIEAGHVPAGRL